MYELWGVCGEVCALKGEGLVCDVVAGKVLNQVPAFAQAPE